LWIVHVYRQISVLVNISLKCGVFFHFGRLHFERRMFLWKHLWFSILIHSTKNTRVSEFFVLYEKVQNFSQVNNFHWRWRWWDRIQAINLNLFYFSNNIATISNLRDLWVRHEFLCEINIKLILCETMCSTNLTQEVIHINISSISDI